MAGTDPYGLSFWDDFKEGLGYFFGDDFDAKEAERKLRDAQRLLEERLREQVERGIISTDAQLSMVEAMERDISSAAAQMHEIEAEQSKMVRDTAIAIGVTVATGGVAAVGVRGLVSGVGNIVTRVGATSRMGRVGSFFYNSQKFSTVSRTYWAAHGPARGASLHHWLIPQRATWIPLGIRNAGFNLLRLPAMKGLFHPTLGLNQWMGFAARWGGRRAVAAHAVENLIRVGIPAGGAAWGYGWYRVGNSASPWSR
jgi:hypothetical protein